MERAALPGIERVWAETRRSFARHTHDCYGIGLVDRGGHRSASGRGMVEAGVGTPISVNPGEVHDGESIGGSLRAWRMIYLSRESVGRLIGEDGAHEFHFPAFDRPGLRHVFDRAFAALGEDAAPLAREEALTALLGTTLGPARARARHFPAGLQHARAMIDDDPAAERTLDALALAAGVSRFQLVRHFARMTGLTPFAYRNQRRLEMARGLIARGTPLAEAAAASGFADQSHLSRAFGRCYGYPPGAFARAAAPGAGLQ